MTRYAFVTEWQIPAPVERVWNELMAPDRWPEWRSRLPYRLTFIMETNVVMEWGRVGLIQRVARTA